MKSFDIFLFMKTGTKINKTRGRKGSLLILVMVIMAVALILITSAMTITVAARSHYNKAAEMDQSQLTAMSGAKMIGDAVSNGTITTAQLDALAAPATGTTYYLKAASSVSPGMSGQNTTTGSYTTATFKYTNAALDTISVDVTTHIDNAVVDGTGSTETVTLYLKKQVVVDADGFQAVIALESASPQFDFSNMIVGENAPVGALNILVMNSELKTSSSEQVLFSDLIIRHEIENAGGTVFKGNVVLYGNDASISLSSGGNGLVTSAYLFALAGSPPANLPVPPVTNELTNSYTSPLSASVFTHSVGAIGLCTSTLGEGVKALALYVNNSLFAFSGATGTPNSSSWAGGAVYFPQGIYVDNYGILSFNGKNDYYPSIYKMSSNANVWSNGALATGTGISSNLTTLAATYTSASVKKTIERTLANAKTTAQTQISSLGLLADATAVQSAVNANTLVSLNPFLISGQSGLKATAYYFDVRSDQILSGDLLFDLTDNDITIYIYGDKTLTLSTGALIQFEHGGAHSGRIIMYGNADINIASNYDAGNANNYLLSPTGIVATDGGISAMTSQIITNYANQRFSVACNSNIPLITYPIKTVSGVQKLPSPYLYIYGFGYNNINVGVCSNLQGYVGLYNNSSAGNQGTLHFSDRAVVYGRFECANISADNKMHIPYCPPPFVSGGGGGGSTAKYNKMGYVVK